jgi:hypothetical protein
VKKTLLLCALAATLLPATSAMAGQGLAGCQLAGTAAFPVGLGANQPAPAPTVPAPELGIPQEIDWGPAFTYSFHGELTGCTGTDSTVPPTGDVGASGKIYAGESFPYKGVQYESLGTPTGNGGCSGSHTEGTSVVVWGNDRLSVIDYATDGAAALVGLTGQFRDGSVTLTRVERGPEGEILTDTFPLELGGDYTGGPLAFEPPDPTACTTATGVTTAGISGFLGHGNYQ